jgi:purine-binding chemotaxis protein CheW
MVSYVKPQLIYIKKGKMVKSKKTNQYKILVFTLDELACALNISSVVRVIRALEISKLPKAPEIIKGIIHFRGQIIPVVDIRKRFGHLRREIEANDRIIIADTGKRKVAFFADSVSEMKELKSRHPDSSEESVSFAEYKKGTTEVDNEMMLIHDLEKFLSYDEEKALEEALEEAFYHTKVEVPG